MSEKEPWRINKGDAHWKILNGWLPPLFKKWLAEICRKYALAEEELLVAIAETIRQISYETILILKSETGKEILIPSFIISPNPNGEVKAISAVILKGDKPEAYLTRSETFNKIGPCASILTILQELREVQVRCVGGVGTLGAANDLITAYHYTLVEKAITDFLADKYSDSYYSLIETIIEETLHSFDWQINRSLMDDFSQERAKLSQTVSDPDEKAKIGQALEEKYGFKARVKKIFEILRSDKDLFSPLLEKIQKSAS